jgi:kynureninase
MNSLTVNLHLMMATFYRPTKSRVKIVMEEPAFPSDTYAIKTQIVHHGLDPKDALILARPRKGAFTLQTEDVVDLIEKHADQLAVVMIGAVNFFTGQLFDIAAITKSAQKHGIIAGFDLAHAIGNVPLSLHDWNVDFAVWCSYKYLNAGPGAVAGAFVHERHATNTELPRSRAGSAMIPTHDSGCTLNRISFQSRQRTAGKSATRRFSRWHRCALHLQSSIKQEGLVRCGRNRPS